MIIIGDVRYTEYEYILNEVTVDSNLLVIIISTIAKAPDLKDLISVDNVKIHVVVIIV